MIALTSLLRELINLFVDDGALALAIVAVVASAAILARLIPEVPLAAGAVLLFGCLGVLLANTLRACPRTSESGRAGFCWRAGFPLESRGYIVLA